MTSSVIARPYFGCSHGAGPEQADIPGQIRLTRTQLVLSFYSPPKPSISLRPRVQGAVDLSTSNQCRIGTTCCHEICVRPATGKPPHSSEGVSGNDGATAPIGLTCWPSAVLTLVAVACIVTRWVLVRLRAAVLVSTSAFDSDGPPGRYGARGSVLPSGRHRLGRRAW